MKTDTSGMIAHINEVAQLIDRAAYKRGYEEGLNAGKDQASKDGYEKGYEDGHKDATVEIREFLDSYEDDDDTEVIVFCDDIGELIAHIKITTDDVNKFGER